MEEQLTSIEEQFQRIEERLKTIEGKLSEKWFLPVFITILTSLLALSSFFIQRSFNKGDVSKNRQSEIIGQYVAQSKVDFYKGCKNYLNTIDEQFESFCKIGNSEQVGRQLDSTLITFRKFVLGQQVIDQSIIEPVKKYAEFISETAFDITSKNLRKEQSIRYYQESQSPFSEASKTLDIGIQQILKQ
jgi:hypothetical protein